MTDANITPKLKGWGVRVTWACDSCGKEKTTQPSLRRRFCSVSCANKTMYSGPLTAKPCNVCGETKPINLFPANGSYFRSYCKECDKRRSSAKYHRNKALRPTAKRGRKVLFVDRKCEVCSEIFQTKPSKFKRACGTKCGRVLAGRLSSERGNVPIIACGVCGKEFRSRASGGERIKYCGPICSRKGGGQNRSKPNRRAPFCIVDYRHCTVCNEVFISRQGKSHCGGQECTERYTLAQYAIYRERRALKLHGPKKTIACKSCGKQFLQEHRSQLFCSDRCCHAEHKTENHRARARRLGVAYERIDRLRVFERDGWKCRMCRRPSPRELVGSISMLAPELDHIVPMSKMGPHLYWNVQLLCRRCNLVKGAAIISFPAVRGYDRLAWARFIQPHLHSIFTHEGQRDQRRMSNRLAHFNNKG